MNESVAGSLSAFNIYFADGQCLLLTRDATWVVDRIRSFGQSNLAEFSIAPVDENSLEEMCLCSIAQVFAVSGRETEQEIKRLTALPRARNAARILAWDARGTSPKRLGFSKLVRLPILDEDSLRILFSIVAGGSAPDVFISYSRADVAFVDAMNAKLRRFGMKTWVDTARIQRGYRAASLG